MRSYRVAALGPYLKPGGAEWAKVQQEEIKLMPTPLAMQPTAYIRNSWEGKPYGQAQSLRVASVHDGATLALFARWTGISPSGKDFPDALAIALPVSGKPALATMGAPDAPIHFLRWQANKSGVRSILANGIGQSRPGADIKAGAQALAEGDAWSVVITRALGHGKEVAPLAPGKKTGVGFAVWMGGNDERAGIKAFSIDWAELALDA